MWKLWWPSSEQPKIDNQNNWKQVHAGSKLIEFHGAV